MPLSPWRGEHRWHLISLYAALFSLISVKAVTVQALPGVLTASAGKPELVAEALGAWTAASAAIEFISLPAIGAWSDAVRVRVRVRVRVNPDPDPNPNPSPKPNPHPQPNQARGATLSGASHS